MHFFISVVHRVVVMMMCRCEREREREREKDEENIDPKFIIDYRK